MVGKWEGLKDMYDSLQNTGGRFNILELRVPLEHQVEYLLYSFLSRNRRRKQLNERDYKRFEEKLESADISRVEKKKIIFKLAMSSEIRAFRLLEKYMQHPDEELVHWTTMALMECRIAIETELSDERQVYISTGLGGKGEKLRFYVLFMSSFEKPFADFQREVMEKEFGYILPEYDCEIERLTFKDTYVELVFLNPVTNNFHKMLDLVVEECNLYGNFLSKNFTVTNVKELNQDEVNQVLKEFKSKKSRSSSK